MYLIIWLISEYITKICLSAAVIYFPDVLCLLSVYWLPDTAPVLPAHLQVEFEVPQACKFILHTKSCALSEVTHMDAQGQPVYEPAATSDAFEAAMAKWV